MNDKSELFYLLPHYLRSGLKCEVFNKGERIVGTVNAAYSDGTLSFNDIVEAEQGFESVKPYFYRLSDLTRSIIHEGEKIVPIDRLGWVLGHNGCGIGEILSFGDAHSGTVNVLDYAGAYHSLLKWRFWVGDQDYFQKGYILNAHTATLNPYLK